MPLQKSQANTFNSECCLGTASPSGGVCCVYPVQVRLSSKEELYAGPIASPESKACHKTCFSGAQCLCSFGAGHS